MKKNDISPDLTLKDNILIEKQIRKAKVYLFLNNEYVYKICSDIDNKYAPSLEEDKNNPSLWKPQHWNWFIEKYNLDD